MIAKQSVDAQDPIFWTDSVREKRRLSTGPTELEPCPICGKQAIVERLVCVRTDGTYEIAQWRCGNIVKTGYMGKPKPGAHPMHRVERKIETSPALPAEPMPDAPASAPEIGQLTHLVAQLAGAVSALASGQQAIVDKVQQLQMPVVNPAASSVEDWQRAAALLAARTPPTAPVVPAAPKPPVDLALIAPIAEESAIEGGPTIGEMIGNYRAASRVRAGYLPHYGALTKSLGSIPARSLTRQRLDQWLESAGLTAATAASYLKRLKHAYAWGMPEHWLASESVAKILNPSPVRTINVGKKLKPRPVAATEIPDEGTIPGLTVEQLLTYNLEDCYRRNKRATWKPAELESRRFIRLWGPKLASNLTCAEVETWANARLETHSGSTVKKELSFLQRAYNLALARDWLEVSPLRKLKVKLKKGRRHQVLSESDEARLKADYLEHYPPHIWDFERFAILTGLRVGEQIRLEPRHMQGAILEVPEDGKTGKRLVPLCKEAQQIAQRQLEWAARHQSKWLWLPHNANEDRLAVSAGHVCHYWRPALRRLGLTAYQRRDLRRTFASRLIAKGVPIFEVQRLLGHTDTKTTQIYCQVGIEQLHSSVSVFDE